MFDFGFWEITLILIVSLIVIGPDKLPSFAAQIGTWVRKLKILANNFRNSIENESEVSELKKIISEQKTQISDIQKSVDEKFNEKDK